MTHNTKGQSATILVVDDYAANVEIVRALLLSEGYQVIEAFSGMQALELVASLSPDLVLLDILMPEMDGFTTCREIKKLSEPHFLPVILLSALQSSEDKIRGIEAGADDFVCKPFDSPELIARIRAGLRARERHEQMLLELLEARSQADAFREQEKAGENLVQLIVHDMNNPLTAIIGNLELMAAMRPPLDLPRQESLTAARSAARRLKRMVQSLLEVSRLEKADEVFRIWSENISVQDFVQETLDGMGDSLALPGLTLDVDVAPAKLRIDRGLIEHVLANLLDHSLKNAGKALSIRITGEKNGTSAQYLVRVADNGPAILQEYREAVFEKEQQHLLRAAGMPRGLGLGLVFCRLAIEAHGGKIWLDTREDNEDTGRRICFTLPLAQE